MRYEEKEVHEALAAEMPRTEAAIRKRVATLRDHAPESLQMLVDGYVQMLDAIISTDGDETTTFVAGEEREAWLEVLAGTRNYVRSNSFYIREDPALFETIFGFSMHEGIE